VKYDKAWRQLYMPHVDNSTVTVCDKSDKSRFLLVALSFSSNIQGGPKTSGSCSTA